MDSVAEKEMTFFLVSRIIMVPYHFERLIMGGTCEEDLTAKISSLYKMSKTLTNNSCRHKTHVTMKGRTRRTRHAAVNKMSTNEEGIIPCGTATATAVLDLQALPEACIACVISLTTPPDACRLSSVSRTFRSAAESDAVWSKFLPPEIPAILSPHALNCRSKSKEFYLALCDQPVLIDEGKMVNSSTLFFNMSTYV